VQKPLHIHRNAPCHAKCPAGEDPQAYLALVEAGQFKQAWQHIVDVNPLPATTGRVCPHFCETACNRRHLDEPIAIHAVERYLGDQALKKNWALPTYQGTARQERIAVVGAGPAGLSCAYQLSRLGYAVTVFEAMPNGGGTLQSALPEYRLPRDVLNAEVERILACGITFEPNKRLGRDLSLAELQSDYQGIFLGPGNQKSRPWAVDGVVPRDLHQALDLLKEWTTVGTVPVQKSAAVVGAGNTAVDIARILRRCGVPEVHLVAHKAIPGPGIPEEDAMTVNSREIEQALEEGVIIHEHRGIRRLILRGERVVGIELVHMKKLPDVNGHMKRVAFEGTETVLKVEHVIPAIGQLVDAQGMEFVVNEKGMIEIEPSFRVPHQQNIFAGGDAVGAGTVTAAVGHGRRAAAAMDAYIRNHEPVVQGENSDDFIEYNNINIHYYESAPRPAEPTLEVSNRTDLQEVVKTLPVADITHEAQRCFSCGNCLACDNCWTLCPDSAVLKTQETASDGSHYVFDYTYCKGCGLCANECPCGYIAMQPEV
jgi:NADPH-dependent glutamate synthase beta subunit-like oxidoreductase/Pyruvate/2-oxoacid:ferredoxin oxidoreductase delta subunit